jgi:predicted dehydrogenase
VTALLEMAAGPVCSYVLTHQASVPEYRWVLQSERGALRCLAERGAWEWLPRGPVEQFAAAGPAEPVPAAPPRRSEQGVVDDWLRYIEEGVEPGISGRRNLETLAACEMVLRAAKAGRAVERGELALAGVPGS